MAGNPVRRAVAALSFAALAASLTACGVTGAVQEGVEEEAAPSEATENTVQTAMGEVEVPAEPERVVVLDTDALDSAVTLGVTPVGSAIGDAGMPVSTYLPEESVEGVEKVGVTWEPNLEAVAGLKPDLILGSKVRHEKWYEELSQIAPTVFTETTGPTWQENFQVHADALGKEDEAQGVVEDYEAHVDEVIEELGGEEKAAETTVGFTRFIEGAPTRLYLNDTFIGSILEDLGVGRPKHLKETGFSLDIGPEQIDKANADVIFYSTYGDPKAAKETAITNGPLWQELDAVKNGQVFRVDDTLWMLGIGYTGAEQILDEMAGHLSS
jgi:iron complex transport system substrate-binding protein